MNTNCGVDVHIVTVGLGPPGPPASISTVVGNGQEYQNWDVHAFAEHGAERMLLLGRIACRVILPINYLLLYG